MLCASIQLSGDRNNHWCTHLSLSSSVLYMQMQQKSIRNHNNCRCRRNRKRIAAFVKIAILFWRSGWDSPAGSQTVHRTVCDGVAVALFESRPRKYHAKKQKNAKMRSSVFLAERVGFEPTCGCSPQTDFESAPL